MPVLSQFNLSIGPWVGMVVAVYVLIMMFVGWYMSSEVSHESFKNTIHLFSLGMLCYLMGWQLTLVFGWEFIGVMSFLLIGFWFRSEAKSSGMAAVMYNRMGDFALMVMVMGMNLNWIWVIIAVLGKSALWILGYWLPMAMEGPTPVSSLLHSSTMVVASVMLGMLLSIDSSIGIIGVVLPMLFLSGWFDVKKMIAFSTSVHLGVMSMTMMSGMFGLTLFHIITHAFVKATAFVTSSVFISFMSGQDMRAWGVNFLGSVMAMAFLLLVGVSGSMVFGSKESVVLEMVSMFIVVIGWKYSKMFFNQFGSYVSSYSVMSGSVYLYMFMGGWGYLDVDSVSLIFMMGGAVMVLNSFNGYVVNK